jgi:hypothetical protein
MFMYIPSDPLLASIALDFTPSATPHFSVKLLLSRKTGYLQMTRELQSQAKTARGFETAMDAIKRERSAAAASASQGEQTLPSTELEESVPPSSKRKPDKQQLRPTTPNGAIIDSRKKDTRHREVATGGVGGGPTFGVWRAQFTVQSRRHAREKKVRSTREGRHELAARGRNDLVQNAGTTYHQRKERIMERRQE